MYVVAVQEPLERHLHASAASHERAVVDDEEREERTRESKRREKEREKERGRKGTRRSEKCPTISDHSLAGCKAKHRQSLGRLGALRPRRAPKEPTANDAAARSGGGPAGHEDPTLNTNAQAPSQASQRRVTHAATNTAPSPTPHAPN